MHLYAPHQRRSCTPGTLWMDMCVPRSAPLPSPLPAVCRCVAWAPSHWARPSPTRRAPPQVGAALSMVYTSGAPVMFVGCGQTYVDLKKLNIKSVVKSLLK